MCVCLFFVFQSRFPEISEFIKLNSHDFPNLKVEFVRGADPTLVLKGEKKSDDGAVPVPVPVQESVNVDGWKRESFIQFFAEMLEIVPIQKAHAAADSVTTPAA